MDTIVARSSYLKINKAVYFRVYKPSSTGPTSYFTECDNDNLMITRLGRTPHTEEIIMECALEAFAEAHKDTIDTFQKYEAEWNDKKVTYGYTGTVYKEFKIYFIRQLKNLYTDKRGTHHQANSAMALRVAALEATMADNTDVLDDLVEETASAFLGRSIAGDNAASTDTTLASTTTMRALLSEQATQHAANQRAFEARIEQLVTSNGGSNGASNRGSRKKSEKTTRNTSTAVARQYIKYCGSHGVNLSHTSGDCKDHKPGHEDLATYANKMGGSMRGNDWWMKWRTPDGQLCTECPPG